MFKIYNLANSGQVFAGISSGFLDYVPHGKFMEVANVQEADIIFISGDVANGVFNIRLQGLKGDLKNAKEMANIWMALSEKPLIVWVDTRGPSIHRDPAILASDVTGLSDRDILISPASLPRKFKLFTNAWHIEKSIFRPRARFERVKGSIATMFTQVINKTPDFSSNDVLGEIMDIVSHLFITGIQKLEDEVLSPFGNLMAKVSIENLTYPMGVVQKLSIAEFVLITQTGIGVEMMGVEGGLCGCQPIYPDTEFYRDIFEGTGVVFFDIKNPVESLRKIVQAGSNFDEKTTESFRAKFSAEDTLPEFWDQVYELYSE